MLKDVIQLKLLTAMKHIMTRIYFPVSLYDLINRYYSKGCHFFTYIYDKKSL